MNTSIRLVIVGSNSSPNRDLQCPSLWLLHTQGRATVSLQVTYDIYGKPHVLNKKAA